MKIGRKAGREVQFGIKRTVYQAKSEERTWEQGMSKLEKGKIGQREIDK
jgi:hypothetical protein